MHAIEDNINEKYANKVCNNYQCHLEKLIKIEQLTL